MKIIKHRKPSSTYRGSCQNCGCLIECDEGETKTVFDRNETSRYVKCPECDNTHLWVVKK